MDGDNAATRYHAAMQTSPTVLDPDSPAAALERELLAEIPLARAMALGVAAYDGATLALAAPLEANCNDKGCAFGGSLASLMTLAGWGLARLALQAAGREADIYVQDSTIHYLAPVWQDFVAVAQAGAGADLDAFAAAFAARGKARLRVHCQVPLPGGAAAATLEAHFVALAAGAAPRPGAGTGSA
jgi:thioesterase domain-containing protein